MEHSFWLNFSTLSTFFFFILKDHDVYSFNLVRQMAFSCWNGITDRSTGGEIFPFFQKVQCPRLKTNSSLLFYVAALLVWRSYDCKLSYYDYSLKLPYFRTQQISHHPLAAFSYEANICSMCFSSCLQTSQMASRIYTRQSNYMAEKNGVIRAVAGRHTYILYIFGSCQKIEHSNSHCSNSHFFSVLAFDILVLFSFPSGMYHDLMIAQVHVHCAVRAKTLFHQHNIISNYIQPSSLFLPSRFFFPFCPENSRNCQIKT